ncbi:D-alanyl-D-alanine carboxypeptidase [Ornithinibacillus gellani]|uniref:serine hydrolase n=1 Tax=Ornithinibacillus gellani TaxID=2293253 RepID=UPI000F477901|nr:serine hydrolase [Ornithinibacillus gellani]TQS76362.1 D-alanyl-D-alanine carboxypeptidase [Ornithinibacillus gellani]
MKYKLKKSMALMLGLLVMLATLFGQPMSSQAKSFDLEAESAILVDAETGKVLFAKNPDLVLPPASMTKMMTEYLVQEAIANGDIDWDTKTQISDYAYSISANAYFSGVGLRQNKDYQVKELYEAMAINSDNATTIALAELIAGTETDFVKLMNAKAEEMGLTDYEFVNSTGLDNESLGDMRPKGTDEKATNLLSARSTALLAYYLVNDYPEILDISSIPEMDFDGQEIRNWNWMLPHDASFLKPFFYEGVDGLKTGFTELAGNSFTGTAERDGKRLITVVMKTDSREARFEETAKLLDFGFDQFEDKELFPAGYTLKNKSTIPVVKGKEKSVDIETKEAFQIPILKGEEDQYSIDYHIDKSLLDKEGNLVAPIKKGSKVGTAELVYEGDDFGYIFGGKDKKIEVDLVTKQDVEKKNWFMLTLSAIGDFFSNLFTSIVDMVKGWFS